ncbi:PREDICTED: mitochondrial inner membrane protein OXA1L [Ceratosolen solmsi marchali]|uniref:Mitochondrial inner membrane protein OXA1L n=1 Tax=Ceratosolen solmsi marchali TaxID=326594 RepID=A0AAJ6YVI3_9HYME|nr:PREDICTED: mitochondrial inner membrane protein OXA1L [Ceratosolen solmsi marchali]
MFLRTPLFVSCRISTKSNVIIQKEIYHRSLHIASRKLMRNFTIQTDQNHRVCAPIVNVNAAFSRHMSNANSKNDNELPNNPLEDHVSPTLDVELENVILDVPKPPIPLESEIVGDILGEPTFHSIGLGSWYPAGIIQQFLEILHIKAHIPWWATIVATTVCVRLLMFPLTVKMQRYSAKMHNIQPQVQYLQQQLTEARKMGDQLQACRLAYELRDLMNEKGTNPIKNMLLPFIQAPVFLSFYWALRGMVQVPVESMKYGGLSWFENLTVPDKYYLLPLFTSATLALTIEMGTDSLRIQNMGMVKYMLRAMPFVMFPFIINFEGAVLCYWLSTNVCSLVQVNILRIPVVREYFEIPKLIVHDSKKLIMSNKNFTQGFRDSWMNIKMARELNTRQIYDEIVFEKAGRGPVPKTYKINPIKSEHRDIILSKKRD